MLIGDVVGEAKGLGRKRAYQSCWRHPPHIREGGGKAERGRLLPVQRKEWKEESTLFFQQEEREIHHGLGEGG